MDVKIAHARAAGTSHLLQNLPCQDYAGSACSGEAACVALSDGAGSVERSEVASETVVETLLDAFVEKFDYWYTLEEERFIREYLEMCTHAVREKDETLIPACTVLLYAVSREGRSITCHIGDGVIFGVDHEQNACIVSGPENGAEPNETFFVSGPCPQKHLRVTRSEKAAFTDIILCSDGAASPLWNRNTNDFAKALSRISDWMGKYPPECVSQRLQKELDESFREHTQDDMSIAVLHLGSCSYGI